MSLATILLAGLFLPLFPLSAVFTALYQRLRPAGLRVVLLLAWPQAGLLLAGGPAGPIPDWVVALAQTTAALYAFRATPWPWPASV